MKKFKSALCLLLSIVMLFAALPVHAHAYEGDATFQENDEVLQSLREQKARYEDLLKQTSDPGRAAQIERLIHSTVELMEEYIASQSAAEYPEGKYHIVYSPIVALAISYFNGQGYYLAAELLTFARDNNDTATVYRPIYGYQAFQSPVLNEIRLASSDTGTKVFESGSTTWSQDLYYSIHGFSYERYPELNQIHLRDIYDFAPGNGNIAVDMMYEAQQAGVLVPYHVLIECEWHTLTQHDPDPDCITGYHVPYAHCSNCGKYLDSSGRVLTPQEPTADHVIEEGTLCTEARTCIRCHQQLPGSGSHDLVSHPGQAATCTQPGWEAYETCSRCSYTTYQEIPALGHTEVTVSGTAPTCTEPGLTEGKKCSVCGDTLAEQEEIPALGHDIIQDVGVPATCTEPGVAAGEHCSRCSYSSGRSEIPALGHTEVTVPGTAPTCTEPGLTEGKKCSVCGDTLAEQEEIPALGHDIIQDVAVPATCTEPGVAAGEHCSRCSYSSGRTEIPALGHTEEILPGTAPTCTEPGLTEGKKCSVCGDTLAEQEEIPALGHTAGEAVKENEIAATCGADGSYDSVVCCMVCGHELSRDTVMVPATGDHVYATLVESREATCTENGYEIYACGCGVTSTTEIPALGHTNGDVVAENKVEAACTTDGSYDNVIYCTVCKAEISRETVAVPAMGHDYEAVVTAPTCTEDGFTTYTCTVCGDSYVADEVAALGHDYEAVVTAPTCTEDGFTTYTCTVCGDSYVADEVAAPGHDYEAMVTAPTCTEDGFTTYTCTVCGDSYVADEVAAPGHDYEAVVTAPTCTEDGFTTYTCTVCGDSYDTDVVPALGHIWKGTHCENCDATRSNPFTDVPEDSFYINPVLWAVENNVTSGTSATTFSPNAACVRAQVVTFLWRAAGSPEPKSQDNPFVDVAVDAYYCKAVLWAYENGITAGVDDTHFGPDTKCTRAQVVTFLWRVKGSPASDTAVAFQDVHTDAYYYPAVAWAVEQGITAGVSAELFGVNDICTRAQIVTFLYHAMA